MCQDKTRSQPGQWADQELLTAYRSGDEYAATLLFQRYFVRLRALARKQMGGLLRGVEESADLAQSVFQSVFFRGRECRIQLDRDDSLWPLLATITMNKIRNRRKYYCRQRRDRRRQVALKNHDPLETGPTAEDETMLEELKRQLLQPFAQRSPLRSKIIEYLLQDLPVTEIAHHVGTSERTVYKTRQAAMQILEQILAVS